MYTVQMEHQCGCFKRSEFESEKSFEKQQDAYNYANIAAELMNEEFCSKHLFFAQKAEDNMFVIRVAENPNAGGCGTSGSSCGTSCGC
jgi:hypothetical protein